jgi:hypothetical protein
VSRLVVSGQAFCYIVPLDLAKGWWSMSFPAMCNSQGGGVHESILPLHSVQFNLRKFGQPRPVMTELSHECLPSPRVFFDANWFGQGVRLGC